MSEANPPELRKRRWTPWKVFFLAFGLFVVLVVLLVTLAGIRFTVLGRARVETQLAAMREAGEPTTPAELEEHYGLPPGTEDTTVLWTQAVAMLDTPAFEADAYRGNFLFADPQTRQPFFALGCYIERFQQFHPRRFQPTDIFIHPQFQRFELYYRVKYQLSRIMGRSPPATSHLVQFDPAIG